MRRRYSAPRINQSSSGNVTKTSQKEIHGRAWLLEQQLNAFAFEGMFRLAM
jgi:hypothetical protein